MRFLRFSCVYKQTPLFVFEGFEEDFDPFSGSVLADLEKKVVNGEEVFLFRRNDSSQSKSSKFYFLKGGYKSNGPRWASDFHGNYVSMARDKLEAWLNAHGVKVVSFTRGYTNGGGMGTSIVVVEVPNDDKIYPLVVFLKAVSEKLEGKFVLFSDFSEMDLTQAILLGRVQEFQN